MEHRASRGRPRAYDPEKALTAALMEFWKRGYTGTSLDHLSYATKMARPSLYAAFGNKLEIYRKAVQHYADESALRRRQALFDQPSLQQGLEKYFSEIVRAFVTREGEPLGCPILSVISGEAAADPQIGAELAAAVQKIDAQFQQRMQLAADAHEISPDTDVAGIAAMLAALQHTLALRARAGLSKTELMKVARAYISLTLQSAGYVVTDQASD